MPLPLILGAAAAVAGAAGVGSAILGGVKMKKAYEMVGAYEAEMENRHQQNIINSMENAAKLIEEQGLTDIEAEKVMWEAKTQAVIDYKKSEEYQK